MSLRRLMGAGTVAVAALLAAAPAEAKYISVQFGTDSQDEGNWSQDAIKMDAALKQWGNWKAAAQGGTMLIVNKDSTISGALTTLNTTPSAAGDFVLFMYSGHGGKYTNSVEGAPALDAPDERLSTYKNVGGWTRERDDSVANAFAGLNADAIKLGIFSACYAGGMWGEPGLDLNRVKKTAMYGSSGETQSTALDDPFIAALISSMSDKSADLNKDHKVTVQEWFNRANGLVKEANPTFFYSNTATKDDSGSPPSDFYAQPVYFPYDSPYGDNSFNDTVVAYDAPAPVTLLLICAGLIAWRMARLANRPCRR